VGTGLKVIDHGNKVLSAALVVIGGGRDRGGGRPRDRVATDVGSAPDVERLFRDALEAAA
jgi:hypothetical protein